MTASGINWFRGSVDFIQNFFLCLTSQLCGVFVDMVGVGVGEARHGGGVCLPNS